MHEDSSEGGFHGDFSFGHFDQAEHFDSNSGHTDSHGDSSPHTDTG